MDKKNDHINLINVLLLLCIVGEAPLVITILDLTRSEHYDSYSFKKVS